MGNQYNKYFFFFNLNVFVSTQLKWLNFLGQNDSIFFSVHQEKKLSHIDPKSWVTGGTKIRPNFLGQNNSIFSLSAPRERLSHFNFESWVIGGIKIRPNFLGQNDSLFSLS